MAGANGWPTRRQRCNVALTSSIFPQWSLIGECVICFVGFHCRRREFYKLFRSKKAKNFAAQTHKYLLKARTSKATVNQATSTETKVATLTHTKEIYPKKQAKHKTFDKNTIKRCCCAPHIYSSSQLSLWRRLLSDAAANAAANTHGNAAATLWFLRLVGTYKYNYYGGDHAYRD